MIYWTGASVIKEKFPSKQRTFQWNRCFSGSDSVAEHVLHGGTRVGHETIVVYRLHIIHSCIRQKFWSATGEQKHSENHFNEKSYSQPINHEKNISIAYQWQEKLLQRNLHMQEISRHLRLGFTSLQIPTQFHTLWCGDLNYRIDDTREEVLRAAQIPELTPRSSRYTW